MGHRSVHLDSIVENLRLGSASSDMDSLGVGAVCKSLAERNFYKVECGAALSTKVSTHTVTEIPVEHSKRYNERSVKMVWPIMKNKSVGHLAGEKEGNEKKTDKSRKGCPKCGERCKKCGSDCKCVIRRVYVRATMFNYYTDLMH